ncbi:hypothetical protein DXG03_003309 [Asterophora parasitica]|uniref:PH domain-containing protein n=1 Tax=Asterophora parasitica TaxID=117018 RepID=A0A9P7GGF4_9AGAR|nr:hypothetical protein DXG03_003309 [Asterophora parasitica]
MRPNDPFTPSRYQQSRPSTADPTTNTRKARGSILVAASDALSLKFGRRRPSIRQPPMPIILPDVIEICAPRRDEEDEERERLKEVAAQSIGLPVMIKSDAYSLHESIEDTEEEPEVLETSTPADAETYTHYPSTSTPRSPHESSHSVVPTSPVLANRHRSRSLLAHSRTNSIVSAPVPPFPSSFNAINPFQQAGTMLYKFYQPSSLRIFALSRNWRHRFMVLSSPTALVARSSGPSVSYLHLFKSSSGEDKEIERLEINEDSVVFIAEEEVGGRKHVVKVGGVDVGAMKKELNHEEGGRTMWFLHIADSAEAQKWITVIKTAILGQRTVRAGLGLPGSTLGGIEPRGDMDVMLTMRAQGIITSPTTPSTSRPGSSHHLYGNGGSPASSQQDGSNTHNYASSISSHRSQATVSRSVSSGAVSTLKGLFTGGATRPRSASRATSIDSQTQPMREREREPYEGSFGGMGNHLLGNMRPATADATMALGAHAVTTHASLSYAGSGLLLAPEHRLDRKIAIDRPIWAPATSSAVELASAPAKDVRANRTMSLGALSLQPPPRKRWTSAGPARPGPESVFHANANVDGQRKSDSKVVGDEVGPSTKAETETEAPPSPAMGFTFGTPEQRPRAPSIQSVSTLASGDNTTVSVDRSSSSTKRSSFKRWSRQGVLPRRMSPPSGSLPSVPTNQTSASTRGGRLSIDIPPRSRSRTSSTHSDSSQSSFVSSLPSFSNKRASGSSVLSASSLSQTQSPAVSRPSSSHRTSMPPPPRPAPTSALPLAPNQDPPKSDPFPAGSSGSKPSFRDSVAHRAFRLSMIAPKPPPSGVLPPRPDEIQVQTPKPNRRNSSGSYPQPQPTSLDAIPASPPAPVIASPPFPPPMGPLPPTPATITTSPTTSNPPTSPAPRPPSRHISIKQRLRILSAPSPAPSPQSPPPDNVLGDLPSLRRPLTADLNGTTSLSFGNPALSSLSPPHSPPATPIAEKITLYQNDPSFLQFDTPVTPYLPPPRVLPIPPEPYPGVTSLSPPPRRGSKQISVVGPNTESTPEGKESSKVGEQGNGEPGRMMSLSRPGSVISLGIVSM